MAMRNSESDQFQMIFLPFFSPGHMIPMVESAGLFAEQGVKVSIITTPLNTHLIQNHALNSGLQIGVHILKFPYQEVGLPEGCENFFSITDLETAGKLYHAMQLLRPSIEHLFQTCHPHCIIYDGFYPWTTDVAAQLGIPCLMFRPTGHFPLCAAESIKLHAPHKNVQSDDETFLVPGLPDQILMTRSQLPNWVRTPSGYTGLMDQLRESERRSHGVLVNSFYELEPAYADHYRTVTGTKIWGIGPVSLSNKDIADKAGRGHKATIDKHSCLTWLDSKELNSVLYVCFGGSCQFPTPQLLEIAMSLEASGHPFIWVIREVEGEEGGRWLPEGFEERMTESKKGLIIRGWAPQVLILDHPSIGGFLTHCGWNSVLESVSAGMPMITWPLYAEHFYNEKLVTQVMRIGVRAGSENWNLWTDAGKVVVKREKIEKAVTQLMDGSEEAMEMRKRAKEMGEAAKRAIQINGSSYANVTLLIEELKATNRAHKESNGASKLE